MATHHPIAIVMRVFQSSAGRDGSSWPVLLLLLAVMAPLAGMAWMLRAALESEQLAVRQRLVDAYRVQLDRSTQDVAAHWRGLLEELAIAAGGSPREAFQKCVTRLEVDSVVIWDDQGRVAYPTTPKLTAEGEDDPQWKIAERLEFSQRDAAAAAELYESIAAAAKETSIRARAQQAQARCLLKVSKDDDARTILNELRFQTDAADQDGRSIAADAELRLLELAEPGSAEASEIATALVARLNRYQGSELFADQRRFLMHRVRELAPVAADFPTLAAEDLAAEILVANDRRPTGEHLRPTGVNGVWSMTTADGLVTALFRTATLNAQVSSALEKQPAPKGVVLKARSPGEVGGANDELLASSLGPLMPGWRVVMEATDADVFDAAATQRRTLLLSIAAVLVGGTAVMLWFAASGMRGQLRVARLKNDLVATVSHELKTPLASTRLLVDTLLEGDGAVEGRTREYLELISHENARLTRLIDNFLTFSRMERGKHRFSFEMVDVRDVIEQAVAAVRDRFEGVDAELCVEAAGPLWVRGDVEALVTAVINLLDNAWKYSGEQKRVVVRGRAVGDRVLIDVEDNGPGLAPRAAKRVFERFYQVDQRLSRSQGGCGLGLSIVKYIVDAHGGRAEVEGRPGEGCRFTLTLPGQNGQNGIVESNEGSDWSLKQPVQKAEGVL